jgi:hypothetical protein
MFSCRLLSFETQFCWNKLAVLNLVEHLAYVGCFLNVHVRSTLLIRKEMATSSFLSIFIVFSHLLSLAESPRFVAVHFLFHPLQIFCILFICENIDFLFLHGLIYFRFRGMGLILEKMRTFMTLMLPLIVVSLLSYSGRALSPRFITLYQLLSGMLTCSATVQLGSVWYLDTLQIKVWDASGWDCWAGICDSVCL